MNNKKHDDDVAVIQPPNEATSSRQSPSNDPPFEGSLPSSSQPPSIVANSQVLHSNEVQSVVFPLASNCEVSKTLLLSTTTELPTNEELPNETCFVQLPPNETSVHLLANSSLPLLETLGNDERLRFGESNDVPGVRSVSTKCPEYEMVDDENSNSPKDVNEFNFTSGLLMLKTGYGVGSVGAKPVTVFGRKPKFKFKYKFVKKMKVEYFHDQNDASYRDVRLSHRIPLLLRVCVAMIALLLLLAGDVERNPGPTGK